MDEDLFDDCPIGQAIVEYDDMIEAAEAGGVHHVQVDHQGDGTILFIDVSVKIE